MDTLPSEILCLVLNGAPLTRWTATHNWALPGERDPPPPFLDPCWRFAARAVCRLWREVIETPTASEMVGLYGRRHAEHYGDDAENGHSDRCPKWITGRLVCASVIAQWIATDTGPWRSWSDADAVWSWCNAHARASRKHVMAALVASDAPWAVEAAMTTGWRLTFSVGDHRGASSGGGAPLDTLYRSEGVSNCWDDHQHDDVRGLKEALLDVAARRASYRTIATLVERLFAPDRTYALDRALGWACRVGRPETVRALLDGGACAGPTTWTHAACASDPTCFEALLDHAPDGLLPTTNAEDDFQSLDSDWLHAAIAAGRWRILDVCKARGARFDPTSAFLAAARARQPSVLAWLRVHASMAPPAIDLAVAALHAVGPHTGDRARSADALAWLCEAAAYVPSQIDLSTLIARACANRCVECALYLADRWPHETLALDANTLHSFFRACVCGGIAALGRFLAVVDRHERSLGANAVDRIDLWGALVTAHADVSRRWTHMPYMLACMRAAHDVAQQRPVRAADIAQIDNLCLSASTPLPCACVHPKETAAGAWSQGHSSKNIRERDDVGPCTDAGAIAALAPLATWCRPRPVSPNDIAVGWRRDPARTVDGIVHNRLCGHTLDWLASVGLLVPPPPPPPP
ncbi:hypothetical protein psal_cds_1086 [Pandoravirus salinus]|uniref:F-box incomplete domain containing protein n=1 Tax=Pandoravirus salinus TaxID=1349410 RepID=S4W3P9_9VIRU|nr:hypothetical protein psal_cds_1086 [Pandoravirus salinus]AGO85302.2 hypothetical protein psal_cds_1086 [Pandoravirus salinus]